MNEENHSFLLSKQVNCIIIEGKREITTLLIKSKKSFLNNEMQGFKSHFHLHTDSYNSLFILRDS
jgi:hypothetical protein